MVAPCNWEGAIEETKGQSAKAQLQSLADRGMLSAAVGEEEYEQKYLDTSDKNKLRDSECWAAQRLIIKKSESSENAVAQDSTDSTSFSFSPTVIVDAANTLWCKASKGVDHTTGDVLGGNIESRALPVPGAVGAPALDSEIALGDSGIDEQKCQNIIWASQARTNSIEWQEANGFYQLNHSGIDIVSDVARNDWCVQTKTTAEEEAAHDVLLRSTLQV